MSVGRALQWAITQDWAPTDWSTVPAWAVWRREVESGRRSPHTDDALQEAAYWEVEACIAAAFGNQTLAAFYLATAHRVILEGLEEVERERLRAAG